MPPSVRYSREEIGREAYELVREQGIDALTARDLAARLGVSTRPIFTAFLNMDDLESFIREMAYSEIDDAISSSVTAKSSVSDIGRALIRFSEKEKNIWDLAFSGSGRNVSSKDKKKLFPQSTAKALSLIRSKCALCESDAQFVLMHFFLFVISICSFSSSFSIDLKTTEIKKMLDDEYNALVLYVKNKNTSATIFNGEK